MRLIAAAPLVLVAGCAHPEDRRWNMISPDQVALDHHWKPALSVYSFATPPDAKPPLQLRDLAGEGQAAYIAALGSASDQAALRRALQAPIAPEEGLSPTVGPSLDRTMVIDVQRPIRAALGDRLVRTIVTIVPQQADERRGGFAFASYSVVATDTQVQNIAHLETKTEASLAATLAPTIKGTGENGITASGSRSHTSAADISSQYQKLDVEIRPDRMVITRESERGLDVAGNTIVKLKFATTPAVGPDGPSRQPGKAVYLVAGQSLFTTDGPRPAAQASLDLAATRVLPACPLTATVAMAYLVRRVAKDGARYYTEGKQEALYEAEDLPSKQVTLVSAAEATPPLWTIRFEDPAGGLIDDLVAARPATSPRPLVFNNYEAAQSFALWLRRAGARTLSNGTELGLDPSRRGEAAVAPYENGCPRSDVEVPPPPRR